MKQNFAGVPRQVLLLKPWLKRLLNLTLKHLNPIWLAWHCTPVAMAWALSKALLRLQPSLGLSQGCSPTWALPPPPVPQLYNKALIAVTLLRVKETRRV